MRALVLVLALGCGEPADAPPDSAPDARHHNFGRAPTAEELRQEIHFAHGFEDALLEFWRWEFPVLGTRDVVAALDLNDLPGVHVLDMAVVDEGGTEFYRAWHAYSTDADPPASVPHPVTGEALLVEVVEVRDRLARVYRGIPIAGTDFTRHVLVGTYALVGVRDGVSPFAAGFSLVGP